MILYKELFFDGSSDLGRLIGHLETCPLTAAPLPLSWVSWERQPHPLFPTNHGASVKMAGRQSHSSSCHPFFTWTNNNDFLESCNFLPQPHFSPSCASSMTSWGLWLTALSRCFARSWRSLSLGGTNHQRRTAGASWRCPQEGWTWAMVFKSIWGVNLVIYFNWHLWEKKLSIYVNINYHFTTFLQNQPFEIRTGPSPVPQRCIYRLYQAGTSSRCGGCHQQSSSWGCPNSYVSTWR